MHSEQPLENCHDIHVLDKPYYFHLLFYTSTLYALESVVHVFLSSLVSRDVSRDYDIWLLVKLANLFLPNGSIHWFGKIVELLAIHEDVYSFT